MKLTLEFIVTFNVGKPPEHVEDVEQWKCGVEGSVREFGEVMREWIEKQPIIEGAMIKVSKLE